MESIKRLAKVFLVLGIILGVLAIYLFLWMTEPHTVPNDLELIYIIRSRFTVAFALAVSFIALSFALKSTEKAMRKEINALEIRIKEAQKANN